MTFNSLFGYTVFYFVKREHRNINLIIIAQTCQVAKSCTVAKTCEKKSDVEIFGEFTGSLSIKLGINGLGGKVEGKYCQKLLGCQSLKGDIEFTPKPRACIEVPVAGRRCVAF